MIAKCNQWTHTGNAFNYLGKIMLLALLLSLTSVHAGQYAPKESDEAWIELSSNDHRNLSVALYKSKVLVFKKDIAKVSIANPEIADIIVVNPRQMYVLGKALGSTNILVLDESDNLSASISLEIKHDLDNLRQNLRRLLPKEAIHVSSSQGSIVLNGTVSSLTDMRSALALANTFMPQSKGLAKTKGNEQLEGSGVINLLKIEGPQQVMLEVQVAEISKQLLRSIEVDFNFLGTDNGSGSAIDQVLDGRMIPSGQGLLASFTNKNLRLSALMDAAKEKGLAKVLSEPTLTTLSGQEARFVSGGEFPVPVPGSDGKVGIIFKEYGVALKFLPVVLGSNRINLKLDLSVSEISNGNTVTISQDSTTSNLFIPSIKKRSVQNTVELADGQTLGIAGLISDDVRSKVRRFPGLAKIPVIGMLFRSQEFIKGQTELVIFVTPHFARPGFQSEYIKPTDFYIEPNDNEFLFEGKMVAGQ